MLDRIRRELGPDAKINGAERVRVGGVLGFFAKEHYRVVVEAPDVEPDGLKPASTLGPTSQGGDVFSAMANATDDVNDITPDPPAPLTPAPQPPARVTDPPQPPPWVPPVTAGSTDDSAGSFDTVLFRVADTLGDSPTDVGPTFSDPNIAFGVGGGTDTADGATPDVATAGGTDFDMTPADIGPADLAVPADIGPADLADITSGAAL
ncbi:MAG TPA: hypothetical protein VNC61_17395, partial [Acidimicrobiales bacterium]|nr:hypothetical protein [Acidimicrobiales bacterium]